MGKNFSISGKYMLTDKGQVQTKVTTLSELGLEIPMAELEYNGILLKDVTSYSFSTQRDLFDNRFTSYRISIGGIHSGLEDPGHVLWVKNQLLIPHKPLKFSLDGKGMIPDGVDAYPKEVHLKQIAKDKNTYNYQLTIHAQSKQVAFPIPAAECTTNSLDSSIRSSDGSIEIASVDSPPLKTLRNALYDLVKDFKEFRYKYWTGHEFKSEDAHLLVDRIERGWSIESIFDLPENGLGEKAKKDLYDHFLRAIQHRKDGDF